MNYFELISKKRPNIKANSVKSYVIILDKFEETPLNNTKEIMEKVEKLTQGKSDTTYKNYIQAIVVGLDAQEGDNADEIKFYRNILFEKQKIYTTKLATNVKTEKQEEQWVSKAELEIVAKNLKKKIRVEKITSGHVLQDYLISLIYTLLAPRRLEYATCIVTFTRNYEPDKNYLLIRGKQKMNFVFNEFKTAKYDGQVLVECPPQIVAIINKILADRNSDPKLDLLGLVNAIQGQPLFQHTGGGGFNTNNLSKAIKRIFKQPDGREPTLNIIRHVTSSEAVDIEKEAELNTLAKDMGHSRARQLEYAKT